MFRRSSLIGALLVSLCVSVASAQRPPAGGGGGPRGGFGFGGPGAPGGPASQLFLVSVEPVQKELGLKEDQVAKIKELGEAARKEMQGVFGGGFFGQDRDLSEEAREKRRKEAQEKIAAAQKKIHETILPQLSQLLDETQRERLQQIRVQVSGSQALLDAELNKSLGLSKEQSEKLSAINKDFSDKQSELFRRGEGDRDRGNLQERFAKMRELGETRDKQLVEVLTAEQREQFEKLKGKPFDLSQLRRGGFGAGGGPGGGRPGRRPPQEDKKSEN